MHTHPIIWDFYSILIDSNCFSGTLWFVITLHLEIIKGFMRKMYFDPSEPRRDVCRLFFTTESH